MTARRAVCALLVAGTLAASGCAVGDFIVGAPPASQRGHAAAANTLIARRCSNCHEAPDPARMTAAAWDAALVRMKLRMRLPDAEWDSLAAMGRLPRPR